MLVAAAAVAAVFLPIIGPRPDLGAALMQPPVVVKQAVPLILALGAFGAALRLARPGMGVGGWALVLAGGAGRCSAAAVRARWRRCRRRLDAGDDGPEQPANASASSA